MGLKEDILSAVTSAFNAADNVKVDMEYVHTKKTFNELEGTVSAVNDTYNLSVVVDSELFSETENAANLYDIKILFEAATLPIAPSVDDEVNWGTITYKVKSVTTDPARASWTLELTR